MGVSDREAVLLLDEVDAEGAAEKSLAYCGRWRSEEKSICRFLYLRSRRERKSASTHL